MSLSSAVTIEPYCEEDGQIGFYAVLSDGTKRDYNSDEWMRLGESEKKSLERLGNRSMLWKIPSRPDIGKYAGKWDDKIRNGIDEGKLEEIYREYIIDALKDISTRIERFFRRFCHFEDERLYCIMASFVIQTYFKDQFEKSPVLLFDGVSGSGKSTALTALKHLCYRGFFSSNYSTASLVDEVAENGVTLLLDESLRNLSSDRGADLNTFLINGFDREGAIYNRKDMNLNSSVVKNHYTCVAVTTLGGEIPVDLRNRSMMVTMALPDESVELEDIAYLDDAEFERDIHPESIRADLYALKILTDSDGITGLKTGGISFESFRHETKRRMERKDDNGRYLYGHIHNIRYTPKITGRDKAIAYVHYTIGQATMDEDEILEYILENRDNIFNHKTSTMESVLVKAFADLILERWRESYPVLTSTDNWIAEKELLIIANKISMPDIHQRYRYLRGLEGWDQREMEPARRLTLTFGKLRIPYEERGGRTNYMNVSDSNFIVNFKKAVRQYLDPETADYFKRI